MVSSKKRQPQYAGAIASSFGCANAFCPQTVGAAFGAKRVTVDAQNITLGVWDTAGSGTGHFIRFCASGPTQEPIAERYESMSKIYYRGAKAALVCFGTPYGSLVLLGFLEWNDYKVKNDTFLLPNRCNATGEMHSR